MMGNGVDGDGMWLFAVLTVEGLTLLVIVAVRAFGAGVSRPASTRDAPHTTPPPRNRPRQILDERYARGELTTEEYRGRRQALDDP
jgi:putative membrane protein